MAPKCAQSLVLDLYSRGFDKEAVRQHLYSEGYKKARVTQLLCGWPLAGATAGSAPPAMPANAQMSSAAAPFEPSAEAQATTSMGACLRQFPAMTNTLPCFAIAGVMSYVSAQKKTWLASRAVSRQYHQAARTTLLEQIHLRFHSTSFLGGSRRLQKCIRILGATSGSDVGSAVMCLLKGLQDRRPQIQLSCLDELREVTPRGHPEASQSLIEYIHKVRGENGLHSARGWRKCEAFKALSKVASVNNERAIALFVEELLFCHVEDNGRDVWEEPAHMPSVDGLVELGKVGDSHIIDALLAELGTSRFVSPNGFVALYALSKLTNKGNAKVINALLRLMPRFHHVEGLHYSGRFCDAAYSTLCDVVEPCDRPVVGELVGMIAEPVEWRYAFKAVRRATRGDCVRGIRLDVWSYSSEDEGAR